VNAERLVLVINAGSSSLKYQLIDAGTGGTQAKGFVERIGEPSSHATHSGPDGEHGGSLTCGSHREAFDVLLEAFRDHGPDLDSAHLTAVGHRVVHGGERFSEPLVVTEDVLAAVEQLVPLAPLHNPANLEGIRIAQAHFPGTPQVAVFDTAFHHTLPPHAYTYAVPRAWREDHGVRRYGFHGTSHAFVSRRAAELVGLPVTEANVIVLHLGNGASAAAVAGGRSIDTSMGLSPLEGLVMGTRPGDLDPSLPAHLARAGISLEDYDVALNHESGLVGLTGSTDFREVSERVDEGDSDARLAFDVVAYRLRKYVGAYAAALGRVDAVVFTAGVGEHSPTLRAAAMSGLTWFGIELDNEANEAATSGEHRISTDSSRVTVLVVPTNEELEIAQQAAALILGG